MLSTTTLLVSLLLYVALLVGIGWLGQRGGATIKKLSNSPLIYTLTLAVYCTSWTYYGSVGKAATTGMGFLAVYLGPTLAMLFAALMIRRLIKLKNKYRITSIADFLAARYFRSHSIAVLVTIIASIGIMPYIGLQLKAVNSSLAVLRDSQSFNIPGVFANNMPLVTAIFLIVFIIFFGVRQLDPTERHPGIILAIAFESIFKLIAFIAVGLFVCFSLFESPLQMLELAQQSTLKSISNLSIMPDFSQWTMLLLLSASAFFFLPRQFHVAIIENSNPEHFKTAQWGIPLYFFLINLFVVPIALAGLLLNYPPQSADTFVLLLPLQHGSPELTLFVFLGGLSAAIGMVMISSMTLSTMIVNHLVLPIIEQIKILNPLRLKLLQLRWLAVSFIVFGGVLFNHLVGGSYMLVSVGLISFAAVAQFVPAILGGVFWRKGTKNGALLGLASGFIGWAYCLILPLLIHNGWFSEAILKGGLLGLSWLRPEALFNLTSLDSLSHGVFWSLSFNLSAYIIVSLYQSISNEEADYYQRFMHSMSSDNEERITAIEDSEEDIELEPKRNQVIDLLCQYMHFAQASEILFQAEQQVKIYKKSHCNLFALAELERLIDHRISGAIGASAAARALTKIKLLNEHERKKLAGHYSQLLAEMNISPQELKNKINYYRERQILIQKYSEQQATTIQKLQQAIELRQLAEHDKASSQQQLQMIMDFAPSIIYLKNARGEYLEVNNGFLKLFNVTREQVIGKQASEFMDSEMVIMSIANDRQVLEQQQVLEIEEQLIPGVNKTYISVKFPIVDQQQQLIAICGISTDITERIQLEHELKAFSKELESKVKMRTMELQKSNQSLRKTLDDLNETQIQLVEQEKMASLGSLVAGIAHEVNTPIGICVTAISHLEMILTQLNHKFESQDLSKKDFKTAMKDSFDTVNITTNNLFRAAKLIKSFKQVAVDQSSDNIRSFNIYEYIQEVLMSLRPQLKKVAHKVEVNCDKDMFAQCNAGALSQILTNLIMNSLIHGFEGIKQGKIYIIVKKEQQFVHVIYSDNGVGMPADLLKHIFEPFFTTRRGQGGSGLGTHLVYNLVTQSLKGNISVSCAENAGLRFEITFPEI
ncbi:MAG: ATP-binding protein [Pseudomonadota bacterium]